MRGVKRAPRKRRFKARGVRKTGWQRYRRSAPRSNLETRLAEWLKNAGIVFVEQFPIGYVHVDFYIPEAHLVIEICGCYWHACSRAGCQKKLTRQNKGVRAKDKIRYRKILNARYKLMIIWEHDFTDGGEELVLSKIRKRMDKEAA